jgi:hypothetical protein
MHHGRGLKRGWLSCESWQPSYPHAMIFQAPKRDNAVGQHVVVSEEGAVSAPPSPPFLSGDLQVPATGAGYGLQQNPAAPAVQAGARPQARTAPQEVASNGYPQILSTNPTGKRTFRCTTPLRLQCPATFLEEPRTHYVLSAPPVCVGREGPRVMRPVLRPPHASPQHHPSAPMAPPQQPHTYRPTQEVPLPQPRPLQSFMPQSLSQQANNGYDAPAPLGPPRPKPPTNRAAAPPASSPMAYPYPPPSAKPRPSPQGPAGSRASPPHPLPHAPPSSAGGLARPVGVSSMPYSGQRKQPPTPTGPEAYTHGPPPQQQAQGQGQQASRRPPRANAPPMPSGIATSQPQGTLRAPSAGPPTIPYPFSGPPGASTRSTMPPSPFVLPSLTASSCPSRVSPQSRVRCSLVAAPLPRCPPPLGPLPLPRPSGLPWAPLPLPPM